MNQNPAISLRSGFSFEDLYARDGLLRIDQAFLDDVGAADAALHARLLAARQAGGVLAAKAESELLLALAPHLDDFIARLFGIEAEVRALSARHHDLAPLYRVKRLFVQRKAMHKYKTEAAAAIDGDAVGAKLAGLFGEPLTELAFARHVESWQQDEAAHAGAL
ncbi:MAG: hypothetical protein KIT18_07080, partial [Burkholderiales bacterium]|nr:hypothetical protein [Burkholderiales bacterium]